MNKISDIFNDKNDSSQRFNLISRFASEYMPEWFLPMLNDIPRNNFYRQMIKDSVKDKVVIDLGSGTGMWSIEALAQGAKFVYIVERNPILIKYLEFIFKDAPVKIMPANFEKMNKADFNQGQPEVIIHEIFSNTGLGEGLISAFQKVDELFGSKVIDLLPRHIWVEARMQKEAPLVLSPQEKEFLKEKSEVYFELIHSLGIRGWHSTQGIKFEPTEVFTALSVDLKDVRKDGNYSLKPIPVEITPGMVHRVYLSFKFSQHAQGPYFDTISGDNHWGGLMVEFYVSNTYPQGNKLLKLDLEDNLLFKNPVLIDP